MVTDLDWVVQGVIREVNSVYRHKGSTESGNELEESDIEMRRRYVMEASKYVTVGGASSEGDLTDFQFKHGGFLPKKFPNQF